MQSENVKKHKRLKAVSEKYLWETNFTIKELKEITGSPRLVKKKPNKPVQS